MIQFGGQGILLDIEGTTSSISFVHDVMFPFARRELETYLHDNWGSDELSKACEAIARDAGHDSFADWATNRSEADCRNLVRDEVTRLMDGDVKATGLKQLQGLIWRSGFESGEMRAHVYPDVPPALGAWKEAGLDVRIYSSGSVAAQKLFFGHTIQGDLRTMFRGYYDTTAGPKKQAASYRAIAADFGLPPTQILFVSDVTPELSAAGEAGMQLALCIRPGNAPVGANHDFRAIATFDQIQVN